MDHLEDILGMSESGHLLRRSLDLRQAIKIGLHVTLDDVTADELYAMAAIDQMQADFEEEEARKDGKENG